MTTQPLLSKTDQALTYCGFQSNKLLWGGLLTVLAGVAMIAAAQTYLSGRTKIIYTWTGELYGYGTNTNSLRLAYTLGFTLGGAATLGAAFTAVAVKDQRAKRAAVAVLALALAAVAYASIVCALRNSGEMLDGVQMRDGSTRQFLIANEGSLNALKGLSYTLMAVGGVGMALGIGGFIYRRNKAPQIESAQTITLDSEVASD
jgi:hypothetical protein